jgi:glycyl-tRNA synthetase beta chain
MPTLLIEIGCEEIPARFVDSLTKNWCSKLEALLEKENLKQNDTTISTYSTYRRLTLSVANIPSAQDDYEETFNGPPLQIAKNESGEWLPPALGFAKKVGISPNELGNHTSKDAKGREILSYTKKVKGQASIDLLKTLIPDSLQNIELPIAMRWGSNSDTFFRPIHWITALLDDTVIPFTFFDVTSSNTSRGHRFLTKAQDNTIEGIEFTIPHANEYDSTLKNNTVIATPKEREEIIRNFLESNGQSDYDRSLLNEVVNLVETPFPLIGTFDKSYLDLPESVLIQTMAKHQKYFPLFKDGKLTNSFCFIAESITEHNKNSVIEGNERVLKARLEDAKFFWDEDLKKPLETLTPKLSNVLFQKGLGSLLEKTNRIAAIAKHIKEIWGVSVADTDIERAALLCKADLVSNMVYELPDLQGQMGEIYALKSGETTHIAQSIREHYYPLSSTSALPQSELGALLAVADKADTIVACYQNNLIPSGSKDPLGVRRAMLGILAVCHHYGALNFETLFDVAYTTLNKGKQNEDKLDEFFTIRLKTFIEENAAVSYDIAESVVEIAKTNLTSAIHTAKTLSEMKTQQPNEYKTLIETAVRVKRLSKKATNSSVNTALFQKDIEAKAFDAFTSIKDSFSAQNTSELNTVLTTYFEDILVMAEDEKVKENRLGFLSQVHEAYSSVADFERIVI